MRFVMILHHHDAVKLLHVLAASVYLIHAQAHPCEVGREKDTTGTWMWVLPYDKPCLCTQIVMGGINTRTPIRPFHPVYVKSPLLSDNVTKIREHYKLISCEEKGVTESVTMSASLKAALSSTALGISSEETLSQTAAKLSTFVRSFYSTTNKSKTEQDKTTQADTEGASSSLKTDAVETSASADQETTQAPTEIIITSKIKTGPEETTQTETKGVTSSQKTDAVETSVYADPEETTQAETERESSSQKTDAVETTTSSYQEETTQTEIKRGTSSQKTDAKGVTSSQKIDAVETSAYADPEETTQVHTEGARSSQKTDAVEATTFADQEINTQVDTEGTSSSQKTDAVETSASADQEKNTQAPSEAIVTSTIGPETTYRTMISETTTEQQVASTCRAETATTVASATTTQECKPRPLGMRDRTIPDSSITASSHQPSRDPQYARLRGGVNVFWISAGEKSDPWIGPWIQVDLGSSRIVTGLQTKGNNGSTHWVAEVSVKVGMSEACLKYIEDDSGLPKVFDANTDQYRVADIILDESGILTRLVRIYPTLCTANGTPWYTCLMQFEILGCRES